MTYNTINDSVTMPGGEGTLLVGRYRVVKQLGQGGMGSVWLAEDTQLDNKLFAIKMLPSILVSNKRAYAQLKSEALVAMKLTHPNIVTLRAFEENNGNPFLVMDYIDGQTLDDYLSEKGKLSEDEAIRLLKPVAAALDYAHGEGVVHRDVKPANVMIRKDGHSFILDFGIAREVQETMTRVTGKLSSGTLLYMSPEQLNGAPPSSSQDIYSFAAMVYECLNGAPPFSRGLIEHQILNNPPPPLPQGLRIRDSIMRCLAKTPQSRLCNCSDLFVLATSKSVHSGQHNCSLPWWKLRVRGVTGLLAIYFGVGAILSGVGLGFHYITDKREEAARKLDVERQQEELRRRQAEEDRKAQEESNRRKAEAERLAMQQVEEAKRKAEEDARRREEEKQARERELTLQKEEEARKAEEARQAAEAARTKAESDKATALENANVALEALSNDPWLYESVSMKLTQDQRDVLSPLFQEIISGDAEVKKMLESYTEAHPAVKEIRLQQNYRISQFKSVVKSIQNVGVQGISTSLALPTERFENYIVKAGESFVQIAISHGSSIAALKELNGFNDHQLRLRVGQILKVPQKVAQDEAKRRVKEATKKFIAAWDNNHYDEAASLRFQADQKDSKVQLYLGWMYAFGQGGVAKNGEAAVRLFYEVEQRNPVEAWYALGCIHFMGCGVEKDDSKAVEFYKKSAERGYSPAQWNLAVMYKNGKGVVKDEKEALKWCRKAAEHGHPQAQKELRAHNIEL